MISVTGTSRLQTAATVLIPLLFASALHAQVEVTIAPSGGFVGFLRGTTDVRPAMNCEAGVCTPVEGFVDVRPRLTRNWVPALSAGVAFKFLDLGGDVSADTIANKSNVRAGLAAHMVFVPDDAGAKPFPGLTVTVGTESLGVFGGVVFGPGDKLLTEEEELRLPESFSPDLVLASGGRRMSLFFGIVVGGATVIDPSPPASP